MENSLNLDNTYWVLIVFMSVENPFLIEKKLERKTIRRDTVAIFMLGKN